MEFFIQILKIMNIASLLKLGCGSQLNNNAPSNNIISQQFNLL